MSCRLAARSRFSTWTDTSVPLHVACRPEFALLASAVAPHFALAAAHRLPGGRGRTPARTSAPIPRDHKSSSYAPASTADFKVGYWTPVRNHDRGGTRRQRDDVELIVADGDGVPSRVQTRPANRCRSAPGEQTTVTLYRQDRPAVQRRHRQFSRQGDTLRHAADSHWAGRPASPACCPPARRLIVTWAVRSHRSDDSALRAARARRSSICPASPRCPSSGGAGRRRRGDAGHRRATKSTRCWPPIAATGGARPMGSHGRHAGDLSVGRNARTLLAADGAACASCARALSRSWSAAQCPVLRWKPMPTRPIRSRPAGRFLVDVARLANTQRQGVAYAGSGPRESAVGRAHGRMALAKSCSSRPIWNALRSFHGRDALPLANRLLGTQSTGVTRTEDEVRLGEVTTLGFVDLSGQLRGALDQFRRRAAGAVLAGGVVGRRLHCLHRTAGLLPGRSACSAAWKPPGSHSR